MVDRFHRLRHDAVVGRDHENDNVGHLGAASTHACKRFVTRGIDEDDLLLMDLNLISADVLRDTAGFAFGHTALANGVEQ